MSAPGPYDGLLAKLAVLAAEATTTEAAVTIHEAETTIVALAAQIARISTAFEEAVEECEEVEERNLGVLEMCRVHVRAFQHFKTVFDELKVSNS